MRLRGLCQQCLVLTELCGGRYEGCQSVSSRIEQRVKYKGTLAGQRAAATGLERALSLFSKLIRVAAQ